MEHQDKEKRQSLQHDKRLSIQLTAPPILAYRNSIDLPFVPIPLDPTDRKRSLIGSVKDPKAPPGNFFDSIHDPDAPKDRFNFVRIAIFVLGFTGLLPMTMLITANEYWMYKFRDIDVAWANYSATNRTKLQVAFASYQMVATTGPSVLFNIISTFIGHKIAMSIRGRMYFLLLVVVFAINTIFTQIDTDTWQFGFFFITMSSQALLSFAGVLGVVILPITAKFPPNYLKTHLVGNGLSGIVTSTLRLISIMVSPSSTGSAMIYFGVGTTLMAAAGIMFEIMRHTEFYKYYVTTTEKEDADQGIHSFKTVLGITKKVWAVLLLNTIGIIVPATAIITLVVSEGQGNGTLWSDKYFVTIASYFVPAVAEIIGRVFSNALMRFISGKFLGIITVVKILIFTPLVYLSNAQPRHHLPVLLTHDWEYILMMFANYATMGLIINLSMFWTTSLVPPDKMELGFRLVFLAMGICGSFSSPLNILAVELL